MFEKKFVSFLNYFPVTNWVRVTFNEVLRNANEAQWVRCCATNRKVAGSIPAFVSGFFIDIKSFRSHYGPGVPSACNRNEHQKHFLGLKAAGS